MMYSFAVGPDMFSPGQHAVTADGAVHVSFVESLSTVFLTAVSVVLVVFVLTWFSKEIEVRDHTGAEAPPAEPRAAM
jgi:hypothetical protein